ncbi:major facilitator superfamily domain-containing protein [Umbelopsis sp. PMI_123]|nr:major facilitator superfamily domain-containing protein [Umbelopsis sp. PMI_123]
MTEPKTLEAGEQLSDPGITARHGTQYLIPGALVTLLFFLWGFSYGMLDTLNSHFQSVLGITKLQSTWLQVAYFGAYFVMGFPLWPPAGHIMHRFGYKRGIIFGLCLFVIGAICFYPAAISLKYGAFVGCLFVIACGLGTLENAANPYITSLGSPRWASFRINAAQAFNGVGTFISPLIASKAFFADNNSSASTADQLTSVKWAYVGIGCGVFVIMLLFCLAKIPEIDMEAEIVEDSGEKRRASMVSPHYLLGIAAQFLYTGAQVSLASFFINFGTDVGGFTKAASSNYLSYGQIAFTVGRFVGTFLMRFMSSSNLMGIFAVIVTVVNIVVVAVPNPNMTFLLIVIMFFESIMFPTIFALATKDFGRNYKTASSRVVACVCGGAVIPPLQGLIAQERGTQFSFILLIFCYAYVVFYSFFGCHWIKYVDVEDRTDLDEIQNEVQEKQHHEHERTQDDDAEVHEDNGKY